MWENVHTVATPMEPGTRLVKANYPLTPDLVLQRRYHGIVGSIVYLVQMTQFDLAFVYGQLSQFLHNPGPVHLATTESALAYVRGTADWGLTYDDLDADERNVLTFFFKFKSVYYGITSAIGVRNIKIVDRVGRQRLRFRLRHRPQRHWLRYVS